MTSFPRTAGLAAIFTAGFAIVTTLAGAAHPNSTVREAQGVTTELGPTHRRSPTG